MNSQRGVAEIELAILLPFALLLWWLMADLSLWLQQQQRLQQLSHDWVTLLASADEASRQAEPDIWHDWLEQQWPGDSAPAFSVERRSGDEQQQWHSDDCSALRQGEQLQQLAQLSAADDGQSIFWSVSLCAPIPGFLVARFLPQRDAPVLRANSLTVAR
jgi:hypothetical protein